jgi:hypothetical protein
MIDPDVVCMKIMNIPSDTKLPEVRQFLRAFATKNGIDDLTPEGDNSYFARFHTPKDKFQLPMLINQRSFNQSQVSATTLSPNEYPGYSGSGLRCAPMLFESDDYPVPLHPRDVRQAEPKADPTLGQSGQ